MLIDEDPSPGPDEPFHQLTAYKGYALIQGEVLVWTCGFCGLPEDHVIHID